MKLNKPFTDTFLQSLKPKAKEYTKHDGKESGLMIRVKPNKTKTFYFVYSFTGKYKKMSLGEYPTLSLIVAREMVKEYKGLIYRNIDPLAYRKTLQNPVEEKQLTFSEMAEKWRDRRDESGQCKPFPSQRHFNHATCQFSPLFHEKHLTPIFHQPPGTKCRRSVFFNKP